MKRVFILPVFIFLFSCSFLTKDKLTLILPSTIPIEEMSGESVYYTLVYFDGRDVRKQHVPSHVRSISVEVAKGFLSLFLIYPAEGFSPLSGYFEPGGEKSISFQYSPSSIIEFLMDVAQESPYLVRNLSLSTLFSRYKGDEISKRKFLSLLEKGKLNLASDIEGELFTVICENLVRGRWISDRDDIEDIIVSGSAENVSLLLYEGVYVFIHEKMDLMVTLVVGEDGKHISKVHQFLSWY